MAELLGGGRTDNQALRRFRKGTLLQEATVLAQGNLFPKLSLECSGALPYIYIFLNSLFPSFWAVSRVFAALMVVVRRK